MIESFCRARKHYVYYRIFVSFCLLSDIDLPIIF